MESLAEESWDLVIAGTGLVQALLALSLSRSGLKILHVDENSYYGSTDAGLSLDEAELWVQKNESTSRTISAAQLFRPSSSSSRLGASRSYTLSLNPQIVYAQSRFLPALVSSKINTQLEFLAVGSWWIYNNGTLQKVPSSREDVFADDSLSRRDKVGLMKFLRHVLRDEDEESDSQPETLEGSLHSTLATKFKISPSLQLPISALALAQQSVHTTEAEAAVSRIRRHMSSIGYFGPGFGAVISKYAGNAEIAQVCCRACAVGGATYLLGQGMSALTVIENKEDIEVTLTSGVTVKTKQVASGIDHLPQDFVSQIQSNNSLYTSLYRSITVVSSPLQQLFPLTSENGTVPAAAIVVITDASDVDQALNQTPVYLQVHSEDTGECPSGQCVVYASTLQDGKETPLATRERLQAATQKFLEAATEVETSLDRPLAMPEVLWSMSYISKGTSSLLQPTDIYSQDESGRVIVFPPPAQDVAFDDRILEKVEAVWKQILGDKATDAEFMRFEDRSGNQEDESV